MTNDELIVKLQELDDHLFEHENLQYDTKSRRMLADIIAAVSAKGETD